MVSKVFLIKGCYATGVSGVSKGFKTPFKPRLIHQGFSRAYLKGGVDKNPLFGRRGQKGGDNPPWGKPRFGERTTLLLLKGRVCPTRTRGLPFAEEGERAPQNLGATNGE